MSIECIQVLSMNPHFMARLIQSFLTGYGETCSIQDVSLCIPILYHEPARDKLVKARSDSRFESLFNHSSYGWLNKGTLDSSTPACILSL